MREAFRLSGAPGKKPYTGLLITGKMAGEKCPLNGEETSTARDEFSVKLPATIMPCKILPEFGKIVNRGGAWW
jgi:hypothetical protein